MDSSRLVAWTRNWSSELLAHDRSCCREARSWFACFARSHDLPVTRSQRLAGPRWLNRCWSWGPSSWPIHWCKVVTQTTIDCGVFAALAREAFRVKGVSAHAGQVIRQLNPESVAHFERLWAGRPGTFGWTADRYVYHEVTVVLADDEAHGMPRAMVYDATDGHWLEPDGERGYGRDIAIRADLEQHASWGRFSINDQWVELNAA